MEQLLITCQRFLPLVLKGQDLGGKYHNVDKALKTCFGKGYRILPSQGPPSGSFLACPWALRT